MRHKTYVEVNKQGTEAAAVTSTGAIAGAAPGQRPEPLSVAVNQPFLFAIRERKTRAHRFLGAVNQLPNAA